METAVNPPVPAASASPRQIPSLAAASPRLVVSDITIATRQGRARLQAMVRSELQSETWWFEVSPELAENLDTSGNPWVVALLPVAAATGANVAIEAPVDAQLLHNLRRVLEIWRSWYPWMRTVNFACDASLPLGTRGRRTGAFLSGGVDSLFTALRHRDDAAADERATIDELVSVHGFDIPLENRAAFERLRERHHRLANETGRSFIDIVTNLRETRLREVSWGWVAHGCALAASALALGSRYGSVLIPATGGYRDLHPWGSHPLTDPLFSTAMTRFVHDGAAFTRAEKVRFLTQQPVALSVLRVCWESRSEVNCGRCNKCLRTMALLECMGALSRCPTFPEQELDIRALSRAQCRESWDYREFRDLRELARSIGRSDVARAAVTAMRRSHRRQRLEDALRRFERVVRYALTGAGRPTASSPPESSGHSH